MHRLNKDFFRNARFQNTELPHIFPWEIPRECAVSNNEVNQGKGGHRMRKTGDPTCVRDAGSPWKVVKGEPWARVVWAERQPAQTEVD